MNDRPMNDRPMINWHRIFGITLTDYFLDTPFEVELERDFSVRKQILDVAIIRKDGGTFEGEPADGLEDLSDFNLMTYKSGHEAMNADAIDELPTYFTGLRKMLAPKVRRDNTRLLAVSTRYPKALNAAIPLQEDKPGIYLVPWGDRSVKIIVPKETDKIPRNAIWHMHGWEQASVDFGLQNYQWKSEGYSSIIKLLDKAYREEGLRMYTMEDFQKDAAEVILGDMTPEDYVKASSPENVAAIPLEKLAKRLSEKEFLELAHQMYSPEQLKRLMETD